MKIPCVFCFDESFVGHAAVAITSLCAHSDSALKIYCLFFNIPEERLSIILNITRRFHVEVEFINVGEQFSGWKTGFHFSTASYYRLLIENLVPENRAIYLDCDLLITCDLKDLFNIQLGNNFLAGCEDEKGRKTSKITLADDDVYINTGVLVMDLDRMRTEDFFNRARDVYESHTSQIVWADQCVINLAAAGRKSLLERHWNVMAHEQSDGNTLEALYEPFVGNGILHFSGPVKPWHMWSGAWEAALWQSYLRLSGNPLSAASRRPKTVDELNALIRKFESEGKWKEAAKELRLLANHFENRIRKITIS